MSIESYRDLKIWQKVMDLAVVAYELTQRLLQEEKYGLTSQIRRSAVFISANFAESYGRGSTGSHDDPRASLEVTRRDGNASVFRSEFRNREDAQFAYQNSRSLTYLNVTA